MTKLAALLAIGVALTLALEGCASARRAYVPRVELQRIVAYFGHTYVPGWLPHGYVFSRWVSQAGSNDVFGEYLVITFGNHGRRLIWTIDDPQDPQTFSHGDCSKNHDGRVVTVAGRRIVYLGGVVGQTATLCVSKYLAVTVWNAYSATAAEIERAAASTIAVG